LSLLNAKQKPARDAADHGDRLNKLPDDLLLNILERVDTLDAIRTCILSKQTLKLPTMLLLDIYSVSVMV
jgi:hypothetical protein